MMKNFKLFFLSLVFIAGFLTSCSNEDSVVEEQDIDQTEAITESLTQLARQFDAEGDLMPMENPSGNIVFDFGFDFVYPLNLSFNNGTTVTVNSLDELIDIIINSTEDLYVDGIEFPFDVEVYNEDTNSIEVITINNEDDFFDLLDSLDWDNQDSCECFEDYNPVCVEVQAPDGENFVISYPNECYALCDGFTADDFVDNCEDDYNNSGGFECFELNFPLTIITDDNQTITVNSQEELDNALYNAYYFDFVYPFEVTDDEGEVEVINDVLDLIDLLEDCYGEYEEDDCIECQNEEFDPVCVQVESPNGGTDIFTFPNACFAECEGFDSSDFVDCETNNPCDCDLEDFDPVCLEVETATGEIEILAFQNACIAVCEGFDLADTVDCETTVNSDCTPNDIFELLTNCSWSVGNYTYIFNADSTLVITDNATTLAGLWFIANTGGANSPASIMIQGDQNLTDEWFFSGCDVDDVIVTSSANPVVPIVYNCN